MCASKWILPIVTKYTWSEMPFLILFLINDFPFSMFCFESRMVHIGASWTLCIVHHAIKRIQLKKYLLRISNVYLSVSLHTKSANRLMSSSQSWIGLFHVFAKRIETYFIIRIIVGPGSQTHWDYQINCNPFVSLELHSYQCMNSCVYTFYDFYFFFPIFFYGKIFDDFPLVVRVSILVSYKVFIVASIFFHCWLSTSIASILLSFTFTWVSLLFSSALFQWFLFFLFWRYSKTKSIEKLCFFLFRKHLNLFYLYILWALNIFK